MTFLIAITIPRKFINLIISKYAFKNEFVRPEQFGFRNHEEWKFYNEFTKGFMVQSVPIYNILIKLFHLDEFNMNCGVRQAVEDTSLFWSDVEIEMKQ
ncbi:hypothetical protein H8356DRAFT_1341938 [Neocallimastix lanati (nom. inval.)]|nr:hypothetical protein H8356DRAFT_1341938 [Neocallimastix sp. JGI-2020a]